MISADPDERPSAEEILKEIRKLSGDSEISLPPVNTGGSSIPQGGSRLIINMKSNAKPVADVEYKAPVSPETSTTANVNSTNGMWFSSAGDL